MFETLLGDEAAQQYQPAVGNRAKQPQQCNGIFKEDPYLADRAAREQHNLATGPKQKTSEAESLFLACMDLYLLQTSVETHPQFDSPHQANMYML